MMMNTNSVYWLFDLDNTLHHADAGILPIINQRMTAYLARVLRLSLTQASALREEYWRRYGATLAGLQRHHPQIDVMDFLRWSHPLDVIVSACRPVQRVHETLAQLPGRKAVFSNGPSFYVRALCRTMGIDGYFTQLLGCDDFGLLYKPNPQAYQRVFSLLGLDAAQGIMVDDNADNLRTAKALGMRTVWFHQVVQNLSFADWQVSSMTSLADVARNGFIPARETIRQSTISLK